MTKINLHGVVGWDIDAEAFANTIDSLSGDIELDLNSGGGFVTDGVSILNKIRSYNKGEITANISYAASMMTQIALACDKVKVYDNAIFMIHNVQNIVVGDHHDMREAADLQERMSNMLAQLYVKKTGKSLDEVKAMMDADTYLFGSEIQDMGFADEVIDTDKDKDQMTAMHNAKELSQKAYSAMKEEKLSLSDLKSNFKACEGNCTLATMPSDNEKIVNSNIGADMKFNEDNFNLLMEQNKVFQANRDTMTARNETLTAKLSDATAVLDITKTELATAKADLEANSEKLSDAVAKLEDAETRVAEAIACSVDSDTAIAMLKANSKEEASKLANEFRASSGASGQPDAEEAEAKKTEAKEEEELKLAMSVAQSLSIKK